MISKIIERPVTATVIAIILVILGWLALKKLPMETFPDIAPPSVIVSARYPGANAEAVARAVATPLEQAINGVENMTYMSSTSSNDGSLAISIFFELGTDPDQASVHVQNRVAQAVNQLPQEVVQNGIVTAKQQNGMIMFLDLHAKDNRYDGAFINNYALINLVPQIQRIKAVGKAALYGNKDYAMRIWLNPAQLATHSITPQEVIQAINNQNLEAAPGRLGEGSSTTYEYAIRYKGKLNKEPDYENIVLRAGTDGQLLRLKDVARIEFGSLDHVYASAVTINNKPDAGIFVYQTPGSNANEIQTAILKLMDEEAKKFPEGLRYDVSFSTKQFLDASISQVKHTLAEAFVLVFIVVFIFLQDFRSTLIPAIAVPVSIIGTFFFMQLFGFTINLLTLFALILAIGIVVDDAIVVVEAVHAKLESHTNARKATRSAMGEITGAIFSITLVMAAVFLPVGLVSGPVGVFYRQFAFTLAIAILLSAVNALTLSPALCAMLLKPFHHDKANSRPRFFTLFNAGFTAGTRRYIQVVRLLIRRKWLALGIVVLTTIIAARLSQTAPKAFIPAEDQNTLMTTLSMQPGTGFARTRQLMDKAEAQVRKMDAVYYNTAVIGENLLAATVSPSYASLYITLKPKKERGAFADIDQITDSINRIFNALPEGNAFTFNMPTVQGFGAVDGLDLVLKDNTGGPVTRLAEQADRFITELQARKEISAAYTTFNAHFPQYQLEVDDIKTKQFGLEVSDVLSTMQAYYGSVYASDFNRFGKYYRVVVQADAPYRADENSLNNIYAKNIRGEMVPLKSVLRMRRVYGPEVINHLNLANAITISVQANKGYSSGDAMKAVNAVAAGLPAGFSHEFLGMAREEQGSGSQMLFIFGLCIVFVYFLLAAQYESYLLPLAVMLSIPTGVMGVFAAIRLAGVTNNIYVQISLIMLIGLLAKNAILMVEFAVQRRRSGLSLTEAALQAATLRLRPILMTSFAFIAGLLPLLFSAGASEQGNRSIATGTIGGMLSGVVLGVFVVPVLFILFQSLHEKLVEG